MAKIDDFIREQFDHAASDERFAFREEHWAQALTLIEAAERKRRRRGLLWWWLTGLLLVGGGWWGWQVAHRPAGARYPATNAPRETSTGSDVPTVPVVVIEHSPTDSKAIDKSQVLDISKKKSGKGIDNQNIKEKIKRNITANIPLKSMQAAATIKSISTPVKGSGNTEKASTASVENRGQSSLLSGVLSPATGQDVRANDLANTVPTTPAVDSMLLANFTARRTMTTLPTAFLPLTKGVGGAGIARVPYDFPRIGPVREPRFAFGLMAAASAYHPASVRERLGSTVDFYAAYWLRPAWSIETGLLWRSQPTGKHTTDTLDVARQLRYRFGYEEETFVQVNQRLHFMEVPLSIRWHRHAWQIEAGAAWGQLINARATLIQSSRSSLAPLPDITDKRRARGDMQEYTRHYVAPFAGLGWQPLRFLQLDVRASYRPTALLKNTAESTDRSAAWRLDVGLRWQLFSVDRIRIKR